MLCARPSRRSPHSISTGKIAVRSVIKALPTFHFYRWACCGGSGTRGMGRAGQGARAVRDKGHGQGGTRGMGRAGRRAGQPKQPRTHAHTPPPPPHTHTHTYTRSYMLTPPHEPVWHVYVRGAPCTPPVPVHMLCPAAAPGVPTPPTLCPAVHLPGCRDNKKVGELTGAVIEKLKNMVLHLK